MFYSDDTAVKYSDSKIWQDILNDVLKKAEEGLRTKLIDEAYADAGSGQHGNYYDASKPFSQMMPYLCCAYLHTKDERFAQKAKELMLYYSGYKKWHSSNSMGQSELNNANFCKAMVYGYTMLGDYLTDAERKIIAQATFEKGIKPIAEDWVLPETRIHALDTMGHNWWIVCVSCAGAAAAAMHSMIDDADFYVSQMANAAKMWFLYKGNPINKKTCNFDDGGFYESVSYLDYSMREYCLFKYVYESVYGKKIFDDTEYLKKYGDFFVYTVIPSADTAKTVNFGDCTEKTIMLSALCILGTGVEQPHLNWYVKQWEGREKTAYDLMFYEEIYQKPSEEPEIKSKFYEKIGWAIFRNSFEKNSPVLAVKCGDTWNHSHADAGNFEFYNHGEAVVFDSGSCEYSDKRYVGYYCSSKAHNTVLFNGKGQDERDIHNHVSNKGHIYNFTDEGNVKYAAADCSGPMGRYFRRHFRHFLWLENFILIYDDIEAYEQGVFEYLLHINEEFSDEFLMLTSAEKAHMNGHPDHEPDIDVPFECYRMMSDENGRGKFVSALLINKNARLKTEELKDGYKISDGSTNIYINKRSDGSIMHRNCLNEFDGYLTDSIIFCEKGSEYFVVNGSILRKDGAVIFDSLERKTALIGIQPKESSSNPPEKA